MERAGGRHLTMEKTVTGWHTSRLGQDVHLVRWGHYGAPVLLFPTAGGDAEEVERFHLIGVLRPLIEAGRIKVYSTDSVAGQHWISGNHPPDYCSRVQNLYDDFIYSEVAPAIRNDCQSDSIEIVTAGASIGAFNAVATVCRHPDAFRVAIGMSGTFDLSRFLNGHMNLDFYFSSPLHYLPDLMGRQLELLQRRFILLPTGEGRYESIDESWRLAGVLGAKGVQNRVDSWGPDWHHDWETWRAMLPHYLAELA